MVRGHVVVEVLTGLLIVAVHELGPIDEGQDEHRERHCEPEGEHGAELRRSQKRVSF